MKQIISVVTGRPGAGKSQHMCRKIAAEPGRYVFACPRIELIQERMADVGRHAKSAGTSPMLVEVHSGTGHFGQVSRQLLDARDNHQGSAHVVVFVTHEALFTTDMEAFQGWHIRIDEVPSCIKAQALRIPVASMLLDRLYEIQDIGSSQWWKLHVKPDARNLHMLMRDQLFSPLVEMHKRAESPQGVFVNVGAWEDLHQSGRSLEWGSVWTLRELKSFDTCAIAAAGYEHSLTNLIAQACHPDHMDVVFENVYAPVTSACAQVEIAYFTDHHRGSTEFWTNDPQGQACVVTVAKYLAGQQVGYWAVNQKIAPRFEGRLQGEQILPRAEGTNSLRHHTSCAYIYSSKPQPADGILCKLFNISMQQIERAREVEDVHQFVYRGAIREAAFNGCYRIFLYEKDQAEHLRVLLEKDGFAVDLIGIEEAGIMDVVRTEKRGRPADDRSRAERQQERRAKDRLRKQAKREGEKARKQKAGEARRRGRPKKEPAPQE